MAITFSTPQEQMMFDNSDFTNDPWGMIWDSINAYHNSYIVKFAIGSESTDPASIVPVDLTHSAFGIGLPGDKLNIPPDLLNIHVPSGGTGYGSFNFVNKKGNHCSISAKFNGNKLNQIMAVTDFKAVNNAETTISFLVSGNACPNLQLSINEYEITDIRTLAAPNKTWNPTLIIPSIIVSTTPNKLVGMEADKFYSIILNFTPQDNTTHLYNIVGINADTLDYIGEIDIKIESANYDIAPDAYIQGGCQSQDVVLYDLDTKLQIPWGGEPTGPWDTVLKPKTDYGFAAVIHNNSLFDAVNTVVRFWDFPHGLSSEGILLDVQTVTVPANDSVEVSSGHNFTSADDGEHKCAVVSIYNSQVSTSSPDGITAGAIDDPNLNYNHSYTAWRNTESHYVHSPFHFNLGLNHIEREYGPVKIKLQTYYVPLDWYNKPEVINFDNVLKSAGVQRRVPLYMIPELRKTMKSIDIKLGIRAKGIIKIEAERFRNNFKIHPVKGKPTPFEIHGDVPENTKNGDIILVNVIANYPKTKKSPAKSIEFLQVLHVKR